MAQPKEALVAQTKKINITSNYNVSDNNVKINAGDSIEFSSEANQACSTFFNPAGTFANQPVPANGSAPAQATAANQTPITADYVVIEPDGVTTTGPYSVTVDNGPLQLQVDSYGNCSIGNAAIPNNGALFFTYNQSGPNPPATITVNFDDANEFYNQQGVAVPSQILNAGNNAPLTGRGNNKTVTYWFRGTEEETGVGGSGTGTIKVGSS
jgi:hypothetical protein